jgi:hypothetical protein
MAFTNYTIVPEDGNVVIDGYLAQGVSMAGIPATVQSVQWYGLRGSGTINYKQNPTTGELPIPAEFTDPADFSTQTTEAESIIYAYQNPVNYYFTQETTYGGVVYFTGNLFVSTEVGWPQPPNTVTVAPPVPTNGQSLYWDGSAWVTASFDITLSLTDAKTSLINSTQYQGASAVNFQASIYSGVQLTTAPDVNALNTRAYPGTTLGQYQTYVDGLTASTVAQINAATTVPDLYPINPAAIPFTPTAYGTMSGSRTGNDFNDSYYVTFYSNTLVEDDTELFIPATSTVIPYILPNQFNGYSEAFTTGNYTVQIRQSSTGFVLAQYVCPSGPPSVVVSF